MNGTIKIIATVIVSLLFLVGLLFLASGLIVMLFRIWGIYLPIIRVFYSVVLVSLIRPILFGTSKE